MCLKFIIYAIYCRIMTELSTDSFVYGSALTIENPQVGRFINKGLYTGVELNPNEHNWLICSVPAPSGLEGWEVKWVMVLYDIRNPNGAYGKIDKIGIRDGIRDIQRFENLNLTQTQGWTIRTFYVPPESISIYDFGLGVTIHLDYSQAGQGPTQFLFTSIGLGFGKSTESSGREIPTGGPVEARIKSLQSSAVTQ